VVAAASLDRQTKKGISMTDIDLDRFRAARIIGITGRAGAGKSTAGNWFARNHKTCIHQAFASPIKKMVNELLQSCKPKTWPISPAEYMSPAMKETPIPYAGNKSARELMQTLGTEWGRKAIHPDFWVSLAAAKIERMLGSGFSGETGIAAVFDDVRFANEAEMIRAYGGVILRIERPGSVLDAATASHESEEMDFEADLTYVNDGTLEDMYAWLESIWPGDTPQTAKSAVRG
jgi:hypothetical protein